mmetsp:Transcript_28589/g.48329  ORF Transcript_28589/g.48329 Transcript_28589/m.48329 type:complete len:264 (-) Transcript_28589:162-953(-)
MLRRGAGVFVGGCLAQAPPLVPEARAQSTRRRHGHQRSRRTHWRFRGNELHFSQGEHRKLRNLQPGRNGCGRDACHVGLSDGVRGAPARRRGQGTCGKPFYVGGRHLHIDPAQRNVRRAQGAISRMDRLSHWAGHVLSQERGFAVGIHRNSARQRRATLLRNQEHHRLVQSEEISICSWRAHVQDAGTDHAVHGNLPRLPSAGPHPVQGLCGGVGRERGRRREIRLHRRGGPRLSQGWASRVGGHLGRHRVPQAQIEASWFLP